MSHFVDMLPLATRKGGKNPQGVEIYSNNLYLTRDGKPFCPVMGEIQPDRVKREQWEDRILKMKAAGIDTIAGFLFWVVHEFEEGKFDFSFLDKSFLCYIDNLKGF